MEVRELRPLTVGEILELAIKICRSRYATLIKIVTLIVLPLQVASALIRISTSNSTTLSAEGTIASILVAFGAQLASAACLKSVSNAYLGGHASWQESIDFAWARVGSVMWITVLIYVLAALCLIPFVLPGIYLFVCWLVALPVMLLEGSRGQAALRRSRQLMQGRWWATFWTYLVAAMLIGIVSSVVSAVVLAITGAARAGFAGEVVLTALAGSIGGILTTPFMAAVIIVIYFDLRVRKEGFDLKLLAHDVGTELTRPQEPPWPTTGFGQPDGS